MAVLALATIVLFVVLRTNESLEPNEAVGLLGLYALFLVLVALETAGVLSVMT